MNNYRKGKVGDKLSEGEIVLTSSGRLSSAFPKINCETERKTLNTIKRVEQWLINNAIEEAKFKNDSFALLLFQNESVKNLPQASKDCMEYYLFG